MRAPIYKTAPTPLELKASGDGRTIVGYGSTFDELDSYGDRVQRGAFSESIRARKPLLLWQHKPDEPIGVWTKYVEDDRGLYVEGRLSKTPRGEEARSLIEDGAISGLSIGFFVKGYRLEDEARIIERADLREISVVSMPANEGATIAELRADAAELTIRDVERNFRELLGLSRSEAVQLAAAWRELKSKANPGPWDAASENPDARRDAAAVEALKKLQEALRGGHGTSANDRGAGG